MKMINFMEIISWAMQPIHRVEPSFQPPVPEINDKKRHRCREDTDDNPRKKANEAVLVTGALSGLPSTR
jgi:hypothetical protein